MDVRATTFFLLSALIVSPSTSNKLFFNGSSSSLQISGATIPLKQGFDFSFRTCDGGALLYQAGTNGVFVIEVNPGIVNFTTGGFVPSQLTFSWGVQNVENSIKLGKELDKNLHFTVTFTPGSGNTNSSISVSDGSKTFSASVPNTILDFTGSGPLYAGDASRGGYIGCLESGKNILLKKESSSTVQEGCPLDQQVGCPKRTCPAGFTGYYCDVNINECSQHNCHHFSTCVDGINNFTCVCGPRWTGHLCNKFLGSLCTPNSPCLNSGACQETADRNNYTCVCSHGYTGRNCSIKVTPCDSSPCVNNGTCVVDGPNNDTFKCQCPTGFRGQRCEEDIDECAQLPCDNGQCVDGIGMHTCNCIGSGYYGPKCQYDTNECNISSPCQNNGICHNVAGTYQCRCPSGYNGKNCEVNIDECKPDLCQNGGTCQDGINNYTCQCAPGFNGSNCERDIDDCRPDSCNSHSQCVDAVNNYTCVCLAGYTGMDCAIDIDECDPNPCVNSGNCTQGINQYNCSCQDRYNGTNCEFDMIDDCIPNPCRNNGTCHDGFNLYNCTCQPGFGGSRCEDILDSCHPSPCRNNATCHKVGGDSYNCSCLSGFESVNCSINIDDCANNTCVENATCIDGINNYTCKCPDGYRGDFCEININECHSNPCQNNATCVDGIDGFNCTCLRGFNGTSCENNIDDCPSHGCYNGTCDDGIGNYTCKCYSGFVGRDCEIDIDECLNITCKNGGTCVNTPGFYRCQCTPYATGQFCETDIDECTAKPCNEPYGHCINKQFLPHKCFCENGFIGNDCKENVDDCKLRDACKNGATCKDKIADYECSCVEGWTGKDCDKDIDECELGFCQNGATCENFNGTYTCTCVPGYTDRNCSREIDECASSPCEHNSTCQDLLNDFNCTCTAGYTGKNCSVEIDECSSGPCLNNGTCTDLLADFNCSCNANYTGKQCQHRISSCTPVNPCENNGTCLQGQFNNFTCRCQPGFTGTHCSNITTVGFNGSSYMAVDIPEGEFVLSLQFRTTLATGLLAANSDGTLLLQLKGERLELQRNDSVLSAGKAAKLTNGLWHRVIIAVRVGFLSLEIDNSSCGNDCFVSDNSSPSPVEVARLFFGGLRSMIAVDNFTGCIQDVVIRSRTVIPHEPGTELFNTTVGCPRVPVCSPQPCVHGRCVDKWIEYHCACERPWVGEQCNTSLIAGTFGATASLNPSGRHRRDASNTQNASYSKFLTNGVIIDNNLDLSFFIRTRATSGLVTLLVDSGLTNRVTVVLDNGEIVVEVNNAGAKSNVRSNYRVNDGEWHFVDVNSNTSKVDNQTFPGVIVSPAITLEHTYIGGLDDYSVFPSGALPTKMPFRGCVQDARLNNKLFHFYPLRRISLDSYQLLTQSHVGQGCPGQDVCGALPCGRGGVCQDQWDEYRCDCNPRYGGHDCSLYGCALVNLCPSNTTCVDVAEHYECVHPATFNGSSSSIDYDMTSNASVDAELSFGLRTRYTDAVVMETSQGEDGLKVQIQNGSLSVTYSFGGAYGNVTSGVVVSDGRWHEVRLNSSNGRTYLTVDQQLSSSASGFSASDLTQLLRRTSVVLGSNSRAFKGCLNAVRIGGLLLPFVDYYNSSINVSHLTPLKPHFNASISSLTSGCHGDDACAPGPCVQGACRDIWNAFSCSCHEGWAGPLCNRTANMTCAHKPCKENSTCFNRTDVSMVPNEWQLSDVGVDMFRCSCVAGFGGKVCDKPTDECVPQPCQNGANCTDSHLNYTCECAAGFAGRTCSVNVDDCAQHNCSHNATCVDGIDAYSCTCAPGFNGTFCERDINECASAAGRVGPCVDNGTVSCNNTVGNFECVCKAGYFGRHCQHDPSKSCELLSAPCVKGSCSDNSTGFYCNCSEGFSGRRCEVDVRECDDQPCLNNGTCMDSHSNETRPYFAGYKCICSMDYTGDNCEDLVTPCEPANPCQNNGSCTRISYISYSCNCTEGFGNANCSGLTKFCGPVTPCEHGKCTPLLDDFRCECDEGYQGKRCGDSINKCDPNPCKNDGSCKSVGSGFECTCTDDWVGVQCQTSSPCRATPCENSGTCAHIEPHGNFSCACGEEFTGLRCEIRSPKASTGDMPVGLIVGLVAACLLALIIAVVLIIFVRKRAENGTYSPSRQEVDCGRVEMNPVLKPPPLERLI